MQDDTAPDRCTISMDNVKLCGDRSVPGSPIPICFVHAAMMLEYMRDRFDTMRDEFGVKGPRVITLLAENMGKQQRIARKVREDNATVYYVRVGDLIKIGTTTDLKRRMNAYPPHSVLLATERGGFDVETRRHAQFASDLAAGREWFTASPALLAHIELVKAKAA